MKTPSVWARTAIIGILTLACAGTVLAGDRRTDNTLIGAGLGAAAGAVLSDGDGITTLGGAAVGGLLGNLLTEERSYHRVYWVRGHRHYGPPPRYRSHRHYGPPRHAVARGHYKHHRGHHR